MPIDVISSILKDPMLIIEGMMQKYSDTGAVKGYDYLAFVITSDILGAKVFGMLLDKLKNVSGGKNRIPDDLKDFEVPSLEEW